jgi:hypothetical protein
MMLATSPTMPTLSPKSLWASRLMRGLVVLFLLLDSGIHLALPAPVVQAMTQLGFPLGLTVTIGLIELVCTVLYVIPATSILGAILLTGYLGGAVAAHLRVGNPIFETLIFPILVGALLWGGLLLIEPRLRALVPLRQ